MQPKDFDITEYFNTLPTKPEERKQAVMKIAGWFDGELGTQIKVMGQRLEKQLAMFPLTEREADFYRSGINFGHLLLAWGKDIQMERNGYVIPASSEDDNAFDTSKTN